jgi:NADH dehydrogenase/NADH:ubiquinone oxidoreductase subunit G
VAKVEAELKSSNLSPAQASQAKHILSVSNSDYHKALLEQQIVNFNSLAFIYLFICLEKSHIKSIVQQIASQSKKLSSATGHQVSALKHKIKSELEEFKSIVGEEKHASASKSLEEEEEVVARIASDVKNIKQAVKSAHLSKAVKKVISILKFLFFNEIKPSKKVFGKLLQATSVTFIIGDFVVRIF